MKDIQSLNVEKKIQQPINGRQFSRYKNMNSTSNKLLHNKCFNTIENVHTNLQHFNE